MHVMRHDGVVINRVPLFQQVSIFPVIDFERSFQHHDELLPFVCRQGKGIVVRIDVDDERFHVAVRLAARERMVVHVLACVDGIVRKADGVVRFSAAAHHGAVFFRLVVKESPQPYTQCARYLQQRGKRGDVNVVFYAFNLSGGKPCTFRQFVDADFLGGAQILYFFSDNVRAVHSTNIFINYTADKDNKVFLIDNELTC